jgi:ubiquinone/menaquinone biosynthesis C-methylase UbiE
MPRASEFWDVLAPHHQALENNYLDVPSLRLVLNAIHQPVLVVGAGQGLLVAELQNKGFQCDGVDLSSEMIRHAKVRRGLTLIEADARALPFVDETYRTIIYATGVIDFMGDEEAVGAILNEGRRVVRAEGNIFVAFYRLSGALEHFLTRTGLLSNNAVSQRKCLEMYLLNPAQMVAWVSNEAGVSYFQAGLLLLRMSALSSIREKALTLRMQKIFRNPDTASALLRTAPETQPYRNEAEIRNLFQRLGIPIKQAQASDSCHIMQV